MKKFILFALLLAAVGWGTNYYLSLPQNKAQRRQLTALAERASREAQSQLSSGLTAAQTRLEKQVEPPAPQLTKWEKLLCDLANNERRKRGLNVLQIDPGLATVARGHSREMMQKKYFSHTSPTASRRTTLDRYRLHFKTSPRLIAENIYTLQTKGPRQLTEADMRRAHDAWMKSPGHRANILRAGDVPPRRIGVGITVKGGSFWATQNFSTPM